jgi:hypothetical protein
MARCPAASAFMIRACRQGTESPATHAATCDAAVCLGRVEGRSAAPAWRLAAGVAPRRAAWGLLPLTGLMLAFTAVSLVLIAEPMVLPQAATAEAPSTIAPRSLAAPK